MILPYLYQNYSRHKIIGVTHFLKFRTVTSVLPNNDNVYIYIFIYIYIYILISS